MARFDVEGVRKDYAANRPYYLQVVEEVSHILHSMIAMSDIKIHNVTGRVKEIDSLLEKSTEKEFNDPLMETRDICGVRVVCLFRDDLDRIETVIGDNFSVLSRDDKITSSDGFGYMSIHYICSLKESFSGPRYDRIKGFVFEIQTRTICMDAWAAVSHYLAYKGQWDVPAELQKAMNALSGLFYVADSEFQQVYLSKIAATKLAKGSISENILVSVPTNLDTVTEYLKNKFPSRTLDDSSSISKLVHQMLNAGYDTIEKADKDFNVANEFMLEGERVDPPSGPARTYTAVGALRVALSLASEAMELERCSNKDNPYPSGFDKLLRKRVLEKQSEMSH